MKVETKTLIIAGAIGVLMLVSGLVQAHNPLRLGDSFQDFVEYCIEDTIKYKTGYDNDTKHIWVCTSKIGTDVHIVLDNEVIWYLRELD